MDGLQRNLNSHSPNNQNFTPELSSDIYQFEPKFTPDFSSLGRYVESSSPYEEQNAVSRLQINRSRRYKLKEFAQKVLVGAGIKQGLEYPTNIHPTAGCMHVRISRKVDVHRSKKHGKAFYGGLQTCGNVFTCPICAAKIQEHRRQEIAKAFEATYRGDFGSKKIVMVTLTFSHKIADKIGELLVKQAEAFKKLRAGKVWARIKNKFGFIGLIRTLEVTHGANGWHPHTHEAWIVDKSTDVEDLHREVLARWFKYCKKLGLVGRNVKAFMERSVHIVDNCSTSKYLAKEDGTGNLGIDSPVKWGADRELAKSSSKLGRAAGKHSFELLADYGDGDKKAGKLFLDYAFAMKGRAQIFWSQGLKGLVGVNEKTDEQIVEEHIDSAELLAKLSEYEWDLVCRYKMKSKVLDIAENYGTKGIFSLMENLSRMKMKCYQRE